MILASARSADVSRAADPDSPYPGLRPFDKDEWTIFFGREQMINDVIDQLADKQLVVVHGDSGCGKSSLIRAGVLAQLELEHSRSGLVWRTCAMRPGSAPMDNLAEAVAGLAPGVWSGTDEIHSILNQGRAAAAELAVLLRRSDRTSFCILIDQFEELFSFARKRGRDEAQLFVDILVGLQESPPPGLYAILTVRSEFLGVCARFKGLAEAVNTTQYLLPQMERPALLRAIREPATLYYGEVSRELAERLIADAGGTQDQLPLIQHGLMLLWRRKVGERAYANNSVENGTPVWRLGLDDYQSAGDLAALLSEHADEVMAAAAPDLERQKIVEHLFRALTDINAEGSAVRRPQTLAELVAVTGSDEETLRSIIDQFRAEGVSFLTPYGDAPIEPGTLIDISHEALIRCWQKIADEEDGWLKREFKDGLLWQSLRLQAEKFANNKEQVLAPAETTYNERWLTAIPSPAWTDRYRDCWAGVERLMQASRDARASQINRDILFRRGLLIGLLFLLVLSGFASWNWWRAAAAEAKAQTERDRALLGDSLFRAEQSRNERKNGSGVNAMLLALAGLPENLGATEDRSWVGETAGALVEALGVTRERLVLRGPDADILAAAFSPDGVRIVGGAADGTVRMWDAATGRELDVLEGHGGLVKAVAYSPDGDRIVSGSEDKSVRVWDAASSDKPSRTLLGHEGWVNAAAFSPDGGRIVSGSADRTIRVWDATNGEQLQVLKGHDGEVLAAAFSPDGTLIVSGAKDKTVRVWDAASGKQLQVLNGHEAGANAVAFSSDGGRVVSGSADDTVRAWDTASGQQLQILRGHTGDVLAAAFSPDGTRIVSGSEDRTLRVWEVVTGLSMVLTGHERWVTAAQFSPDSSRVLSASADNTVRTWDVGRLQDLVVLEGHEDDVLAAAFSPDGDRIASGSADSTARLWSRARGRDLGQYGHLGKVLAVAFSPDGKRFVSASADGRARVWTPAGEADSVLVLQSDESSVNDVAFSPDGGRIVTGSADGTVRLWNAASGRQLQFLKAHEVDVLAASLSPNGERIVSGSADKTVRVWDVATGKELHVLRGHERGVNAAVFAPDGGRIVSGSADGTVRVWDAASGKQLQLLTGHEGDVLAVAFSPDGARIVSGGEDRTVRAWDATSDGKFSESLVLSGHEGAVFATAFSPDGTRIVSGADDNTVRITWIGRSKHELIENARARLPRDLTDEERRRYHLALE